MLKSKHILFITLLAFGVMLSETLYILNNNQSSLRLKLAQIYQNNSKYDKAFTQFIKASESRIKNSTAKDHRIPTIGLFRQNQQFYNPISSYIQGLDYLSIEHRPDKWAQPFYAVGILAYRLGNRELAKEYLISATHLAPNWSYYHIEAANLYQIFEDAENSNKIISNCISHNAPADDCKSYFDNYYGKRHLPPGFTIYPNIMLDTYTNHIEKDDIQKALFSLIEAVDVLVEGKTKTDAITNYRSTSSIVNDNLLQKYGNYLKEIDSTLLTPNNPNRLAVVFYNLALLSSQEGENDLAEEFFVRAIYLSPQWSHFHIELANWYIHKENYQKALKTITNCQKQRTTQKECKKFYNTNISQVIKKPVGFLSDKISEIE